MRASAGIGSHYQGMSELDICFLVHEMGVCIQVGPYRGFGGEALLPFREYDALLGAFSTAHKCAPTPNVHHG